jgi:hypothetical protein
MYDTGVTLDIMAHQASNRHFIERRAVPLSTPLVALVPDLLECIPELLRR